MPGRGEISREGDLWGGVAACPILKSSGFLALLESAGMKGSGCRLGG